MNCNNNTAPLISTTTTSCNNGCDLKDIQVVCNQIIIPAGQEILGIQGENNVSTRTFIIPRIIGGDIDLSSADFQILVKIGSSNTVTIDIPEKETLENYIKIKLPVDSSLTETSGNISVQIVATGDGYTWKTYPTQFTIVKSL